MSEVAAIGAAAEGRRIRPGRRPRLPGGQRRAGLRRRGTRCRTGRGRDPHRGRRRARIGTRPGGDRRPRSRSCCRNDQAPRPAVAALEPLTAALLARAHADADRIRAAAEAGRTSRCSTAAREQAAALLGATPGPGARPTRPALLAVERARARRRARAVVLAAQRSAYDELRRSGPRRHAATCSPIPARQARLSAQHPRPAGRRRDVRDHARRRGGRRDPGRAAASTPRSTSLVDRALAELDLEQLWTAR